MMLLETEWAKSCRKSTQGQFEIDKKDIVEYGYSMNKPNRPRDTNQLAKLVVDLATGQAEETFDKDPRAVEHGRLGGLSGGHARYTGTSDEERSEQGRKMAQARWAKRARKAE